MICLPEQDSSHLYTPISPEQLGKWLGPNTDQYKHSIGALEEMNDIVRIGKIQEPYKSLLIQAALLHNVGYSNLVKNTRFQPYDGAVFLHKLGLHRIIVLSTMFHSLAFEQVKYNHPELINIYANAEKTISNSDKLFINFVTHCNLHRMPDGERVCPEYRLTEIVRRYGENSPMGMFTLTNRLAYLEVVYNVEGLIYIRNPKVHF